MVLVWGCVGSINFYCSGGESFVKVIDVFVGCVFWWLIDGLFFVCQGVSFFIMVIVCLY